MTSARLVIGFGSTDARAGAEGSPPSGLFRRDGLAAMVKQDTSMTGRLAKWLPDGLA
jgi:hypothetical protein